MSRRSRGLIEIDLGTIPAKESARSDRRSIGAAKRMTMAMLDLAGFKTNSANAEATEPSATNIRKNSDCWIRGIHGISRSRERVRNLSPSSFYLKDLKISSIAFSWIDRNEA